MRWKCCVWRRSLDVETKPNNNNNKEVVIGWKPHLYTLSRTEELILFSFLVMASMFRRRFLDMHLFLYWWCFFFLSRLLGVVIARNGRITHPQTPIQPHLLHLIKTNYCLHTMLYISSLKKIYCLFGIYYARNVSVAFLQIKIWTDLWAHSLVSVVFFSSLYRASVFHIVSLILSRNRLTFHLCSK